MKHVSILSVYLTIYSNAVQFIPVGQFQAFKLKIGRGLHKEAGLDISPCYYNKMRSDKHCETNGVIPIRPLTCPFKRPRSIEQKGENDTVK